MAVALGGDELWIAWDHSHAIAFCQLTLEQDLVWLESVAVDPTWQGGGIGTALIHKALQAAVISAERPAGLNVSSKNARAIAVYGRLGFTLRREQRRFSASHKGLVKAMQRYRRRKT
jgi:ribosomal protein S18 acetylase RimI-like enzyme